MTCCILEHKHLHAWESVQVELHGQYSLQRLTAFHTYTISATTMHVLAVMLLTPLETLERGLAHSHAFWVQVEFTIFICSHTTVLQIQYDVPKLHIPLRDRVLAGKDDIKPEIVIFNIEIFNVFFVYCCMQSSSSINTKLVIMGADFLQACAGIYDLNKMLVDVRQLAMKMGMREGQTIEIATQMLHNNPRIARHETIRKLLDEPDFAAPSPL